MKPYLSYNFKDSYNFEIVLDIKLYSRPLLRLQLSIDNFFGQRKPVQETFCVSRRSYFLVQKSKVYDTVPHWIKQLFSCLCAFDSVI